MTRYWRAITEFESQNLLDAHSTEQTALQSYYEREGACCKRRRFTAILPFFHAPMTTPIIGLRILGRNETTFWM